MSRVFQAVPVLERGDATGDHALFMSKVLGERHGGFIVERASSDLRSMTTHWSDADVKSDDIVIYHVALASPLSEWVFGVQAKKVIYFHNITPAGYLRVYEPGLSMAVTKAREELARLTDQVVLALANSDYSRRELEHLGFRNTHTLPVFVDFSRFDAEPDSRLRSELVRGKTAKGDVLFVGRIVPNKRHEDLIKAFAAYKRLYNDQARLFLVGVSNSRSYEKALTKFIDRLGIEDIRLTGKVSLAELIAYYRTADVFLSMSEHEGFGAPWLEAMYAGVPVLTYGAAAIPETVGDGALLFRRKDYEEIAALLHLVITDEDLRASLVEAGRKRVQDFVNSDAGSRFIEMIDGLN